MPCLDVSFKVLGSVIPRDHGYSLLSSISRIVPEAHANRSIGILPISGLPAAAGTLNLTAHSRLVIRLPDDLLRVFLPLAGKALELDGSKISLGVPEIFMLKSPPNLQARMVTIKGFMEEARFLEAVNRQLEVMGIKAEPDGSNGSRHLALGPRRVIKIKDKTIVGFALKLHKLSAEESLTVQEQGIGGRRSMGCGIFLPGWGD